MKRVVGYSAFLISISIMFLAFYLISDDFNLNFPSFIVLFLGFAFLIFAGLLIDAIKNDHKDDV